jgi:hypothetical protein
MALMMPFRDQPRVEGSRRVGSPEHFFPDAAHHKRIFTDDQVSKALAKQIGAARALAFAGDPGIGV